MWQKTPVRAEERCSRRSGRRARHWELSTADRRGRAGGSRDTVEEGQSLDWVWQQPVPSSQVQPPVRDKPSEAAKLKIKTESRDLFNVGKRDKGIR